MKLLILPALSITLVSCTLTKNTNLVPISGPLAKNGITQVPASFTWNGSGSGDVTVTMPSGEILKGRYSTIARGSQSFSSGSSYSNASVYGSYGYASGFGSSNYSGSNSTYANEQLGRGIVTGNMGTVLRFEYVSSMSDPTHGHGGGSDNKGNKYSIVF